VIIGSDHSDFAGALSDDGHISGVSVGGDINGDGARDLVLGESSTSGGLVYVAFMDAGFAYVRSHAVLDPLASGSIFTAASLVSGDQFGASLFLGVDVNGDSIPDLAVGAPNAASGDGAAFLIFLDSSGHAKSYVQYSSATSVLTSAFPTGSKFGTDVNLGADVNGDGRMDLVVGAPYDSTSACVFILFLDQAGAVKSFSKISPGETTSILYGYVSTSSLFGNGVSASRGSDVDGDGIVDLAVGTPGTRRGGRTGTRGRDRAGYRGGRDGEEF
jgi:hypothetical protein